MKKLLQLINLSFVLLPASCVSDVSDDPDYPTGFKLGQTYELKRPVYVRKFSDSEVYHLTSFGESYSDPKDKKELERYPSKFPNAVGVVNLGERYSVTKIIRKWNIEYGPSIHVLAESTDLSDLDVDETAKDPGGPSFFGGLPKLSPRTFDLVKSEQSGCQTTQSSVDNAGLGGSFE